MRRYNGFLFSPNAKTQRTRILRLLIDARGGWVPLPELLAYAAQYNARILELRRLGFAIENRTEAINGDRHSWFRLVASPSVDSLKPQSPEPEWKDRKPITGLELWDGLR